MCICTNSLSWSKSQLNGWSLHVNKVKSSVAHLCFQFTFLMHCFTIEGNLRNLATTGVVAINK